MPYQALNPPPHLRDTASGNEVMRAAVNEGELHFSFIRAFNDPAAWGLLFVDAARHVARVYAHEKLCTEDEAIEKMRAAFEEGIRQPPEGSAEVTAVEKPKAG
jgi:hypothetical protein